jgi:hypothetical protein
MCFVYRPLKSLKPRPPLPERLKTHVFFQLKLAGSQISLSQLVRAVFLIRSVNYLQLYISRTGERESETRRRLRPIQTFVCFIINVAAASNSSSCLHCVLHSLRFLCGILHVVRRNGQLSTNANSNGAGVIYAENRGVRPEEVAPSDPAAG